MFVANVMYVAFLDSGRSGIKQLEFVGGIYSIHQFIINKEETIIENQKKKKVRLHDIFPYSIF